MEGHSGPDNSSFTKHENKKRKKFVPNWNVLDTDTLFPDPQNSQSTVSRELRAFSLPVDRTLFKHYPAQNCLEMCADLLAKGAAWMNEAIDQSAIEDQRYIELLLRVADLEDNLSKSNVRADLEKNRREKAEAELKEANIARKLAEKELESCRNGIKDLVGKMKQQLAQAEQLKAKAQDFLFH